MMICPVCEEEFTGTGMRWLGAFGVADMSHDLDEPPDAILDAWFLNDGSGSIDTPDARWPLPDPFGGLDEPDPDLDLNPPRQEDGAETSD